MESHQSQVDRHLGLQASIDAILAKVSAQGMNSLTWLEKRTLKRATERQRKADAAREAKYRRSVN